MTTEEKIICKHFLDDADKTHSCNEYKLLMELLEQEPTTKNSLGVDAVSRADVLKLMQDNWHTHNGDWAMQESMDDIRALPSVTPQEPRWIPTSERLPEERLGVLVWCPTRKNIYCACYEEKQWWIFGAYWEKVTEEIVAWRPLPTKPYSEVEK